eukprot:TRINITY_DN44611_c0_g1_i1.p1 TRINITY_DN44611_c0_g1~~TRINITY_DN44611_c0_g1_i1.p1  ORF type:complete len:637 (-),score=184.10 TRINITY_DN44611_c0_g1_i1:186-2096(-)
MGPSGSGKTTLLNVVAGRTDSGWLSGLRVFNGEVMSKEQYELEMSAQGYMLQTDTFFADLTVREMLVYCAMLRIGEKKTVAEKLVLMDAVLGDVNLTKQAGCVIGGQGSGIAGISGGQRRRLSVAVELLTNPEILILDEPTSGLDATSSHQLVTLLNTLSRRDARTILLTIHQPRAESFELFDQLLLLGEGGYVTYHGAASGAMDYLSKQLPDMDSGSYDNPGDFIIDAVGLDPARNEAETSCVSAGSDLAARYVSGGMEASVLGTVKQFVESTTQPCPKEESSGCLMCGSEGDWQSTVKYQVWVLFARRCQRMAKRWRTEAVVLGQLVLVALVLGYAMMFEGETMSVTGIYQEMAFVFCSISYLMILQYLVSVPEVFEERPIYLQDRLNRSVRPSAYVLSSVLTDTPRAIVHCCLFYAVSYNLVGLNPEAVYAGYTIAVTILAVVAWQAVVGLCSSITDNQGVVYSVLFVLFGTASLFGGLCIPYNNIKDIFKPFYYLSVPAWGYRSVLVNDLVCCHLDMSCDQVYESIMQNEFKRVRDFGESIYTDCLATNGTVSAGQLAVLYTDLAANPDMYNPTKMNGVFVLLLCVVVLRWLSMVTLRVRTKRANFLKMEDPAKSLKRLQDADTPPSHHSVL